MAFNLKDITERKRLVAQLQADVDAFCRKEFAEDPRKHLGASIIGESCKAKIWNAFRWLKFEDASGQLLRLFDRGQQEEQRFTRWLRGIGCTVLETDPATSKQFRVVGANGHFGGALDSKLLLPTRYGLDQEVFWLGEFKTHNEKQFTKLAGPPTKNGKPRMGGVGVKIAKPMHFKQMCSYGRAYKMAWGLYCGVNKNTDELYFEVVEIDETQADALFQRAEEVITSHVRPTKIAKVASFIDCKQCDFVNLCHGDEVPTKNCRSCVNAYPVENAEWFCTLYQSNIPKHAIIEGCDHWTRIA